jgi:hypothetical protein
LINSRGNPDNIVESPEDGLYYSPPAGTREERGNHQQICELKAALDVAHANNKKDLAKLTKQLEAKTKEVQNAIKETHTAQKALSVLQSKALHVRASA